MKIVPLAGLLAVLSLSPTLLHAEPPVRLANTVVNGDFPTDKSGWWPGNAFFPVDWVAGPVFDAFGSPSSGSLRLQVNSAVDFANGGTYQCVAASAGTTYEFGAWIRTPSGQSCGASPCEASVQLVFFDGAGCSGSQVGANVHTSQVYSDGSGGSLDTWLLMTAQTVAPAGTQGAWVYLNVINAQNDAVFTTYFDGVRFGPAPTTPVELTSFGVE